MQGTHSALSGLVAMLVAADILSRNGHAGGYQRDVVFAALSGEAFDLMGSRRLLYDLSNKAADRRTAANLQVRRRLLRGGCVRGLLGAYNRAVPARRACMRAGTARRVYPRGASAPCMHARTREQRCVQGLELELIDAVVEAGMLGYDPATPGGGGEGAAAAGVHSDLFLHRAGAVPSPAAAALVQAANASASNVTVRAPLPACCMHARRCLRARRVAGTLPTHAWRCRCAHRELCARAGARVRAAVPATVVAAGLERGAAGRGRRVPGRV